MEIHELVELRVDIFVAAKLLAVLSYFVQQFDGGRMFGPFLAASDRLGMKLADSYFAQKFGHIDLRRRQHNVIVGHYMHFHTHLLQQHHGRFGASRVYVVAQVDGTAWLIGPCFQFVFFFFYYIFFLLF